MKRIIQSSLTILVALTLVAGASGAFFSDPESTTGNTFASGVINLMVGNESYYNGTATSALSWVDTTSSLEGKLFFNFLDLKPDDEGEDTISLTVDTNDAWACMSVSLTEDDDVSSNEPELEAGDTLDDPDDHWDGELADYLEFLWWADDGDNVFEVGETLLSDGVETLTDLATTSGPFMVALTDSLNVNPWTGITGEPLDAGMTYHIGKAWCFGTLEEAPLPQEDGRSPIDDDGPGVLCDGEMIEDVNRLQTDGVTLDVSFLAMQARHDSEYVCPNEEEPPVPCEVTQSYADEVVFVDQGLKRNGTDTVAPDRSVTSYALGAPESLGTPYDADIVPNSFFSLGFPLGGHTAEIVLAFNDNYVVNATGTDLKLWEVTGGSISKPYPDEKVDVYLGNNPTGPWTQVGFAVTRDAEIEISPVEVARYVRIVDASNLDDFTTRPTADGFDLDAVQATHCIVSPINN